MFIDSPQKERLFWIDWMKVIGMYFIILGHFFPHGYVYIYIFNVPVFFIISGYLCEKEKNKLIFWKKTLRKHIIPLVLIGIVMFIWNWTTWKEGDKLIRSTYFFYYALIGSQKCLGTGWFIYTLIIVRTIFQYSPSKIIAHFSLFICFSILSYFLQNHNLHYFNSVTNAVTAYPIFLIGHFLSYYKNTINNYYKRGIFMLLFFLSILTIYYCGKMNGEVWMYNNDYGKSLFLFILGSIGGVTLLFSISKMIRGLSLITTILSIGNILTLGLHPLLVAAIGPQGGIIDFIISFFILIIFLPAILLANSYFPYILGLYKTYPLTKNINSCQIIKPINFFNIHFNKKNHKNILYILFFIIFVPKD